MAAVIVAAASTASVTHALSEPAKPRLRCASQPLGCQHAIAWARQRRAHDALVIRGLRRDVHKRFAPSSSTAIRLACSVYQVACGTFFRVARCESSLDPYARNGGHLGLFQLGGFHLDDPIFRVAGPFDPYANALHTARYVKAHGWSHGQWECFGG